MSLPNDRDLIRFFSKPGAPWHDFARRFGALVIERAQQIAIQEDIASGSFRGLPSAERGDSEGREYFKNFGVQLLDTGDIVFFNKARHAEWLELGNKPNGPGGYIYPTRAKKLRFRATKGPFKGRIIYVDRVRPIKARHIMEKAVEDVLRRMT